MEQVEVCNSWEEFDDNSKLLEQQLEKLKLQKGLQKLSEPKLEPELLAQDSSPANGVPEEAPKMRILKRNVPKSPEGVENSADVEPTSTNGMTNHSEIVIQDDSMRTQYVPPEPRISILSRPKKKGAEESSESRSQLKAKNQSVKTLEQREQEYAEARRRIFGDELEAVETESSETST